MGCASSVTEERTTKNGTAGGIPEPDAPPPTDPRLPLSARQKFSLEKSWKAVQRSLEGVGMNALIRWVHFIIVHILIILYSIITDRRQIGRLSKYITHALFCLCLI